MGPMRRQNKRPEPRARAAAPVPRAAAPSPPSPRFGFAPVSPRSGLGGSKQAEAPARRPDGLPEPLKTNMEQIGGLALNDVRLHRNSSRPAALGALAFTQGSDIHIAPGQERHLPHEAWHVVQQKQGRVRPTTQMKGVGLNDSPALEREADIFGAAALVGVGHPDGRRPPPVQPGSAHGPQPIQRTVAQIVSDEEDKVVRSLIVADRPKPLFGGSMGAHTTAWVVYIDSIRNAVLKKPLGEAWSGMMALYLGTRDLPGYKLTPSNQRHAQRYQAAEAQLLTTLKAPFPPSSAAQLSLLEQAIVEFLDYRELIPLSVVNRPSTNRDESGASARLRGGTSINAERDIGIIQDPEAVATVFARGDDPALMGLPSNAGPVELLAPFAKQHWLSLFAAYPLLMKGADPDKWSLLMPTMLSEMATAIAQEQVVQAKESERQARFANHDDAQEVEKAKAHKKIADDHLVRLKDWLNQIRQAQKTSSGAKGSDFSSGSSASSASSAEANPLAVAVRFDGLKVVSVAVGGRPRSSFSGTMGAHVTPWAEIKSGLTDPLVGETLIEAAKSIYDRLFGQYLEFETLVDQWPDGRGAEVFSQAGAAVEEMAEAFGQSLTKEKMTLSLLQRGISAALEFENAKPGAAIDKGNTGARAEGHSFALLKQFEDDGKIPKATKMGSGQKRLRRALYSAADIDPELPDETLLEAVTGLQRRYPKAFLAVMKADTVTLEVARNFALASETLADSDASEDSGGESMDDYS